MSTPPRPLLPADAEITLLHVVPSEVAEVASGALAGLLGRGRPGPGRHPAERISALSEESALELLAAAEARLGRAARRAPRRGRVEHVVVEAARDTDLLVVARAGDPFRGRPRPLPSPAGVAGRGARPGVHPPASASWPGSATGIGEHPGLSSHMEQPWQSCAARRF